MGGAHFPVIEKHIDQTCITFVGPGARQREPGTSRFPDAQLRI
jgi:hypothetical protein